MIQCSSLNSQIAFGNPITSTVQSDRKWDRVHIFCVTSITYVCIWKYILKLLINIFLNIFNS